MRILLLLCLLLASCSRPGAKPRVRVAVLSAAVGQLPVYLAKSLGFFEQEGLDVQLEELNSTAKTMEALLGGSADVSATTYEQTLQATAMGRELRSFFLMLVRPNMVLAAVPGRPQIARVQDLKGRTVGVAGLGSASHNYLNLVLIRHGLKPADVTAVSVGAAAPAVAAMENGKVDAALLVSLTFETLRLRKPDTKVLADLRTAEGTEAAFGFSKLPITAAVASPRWLSENPDTARRLTRALVRAARWIDGHSTAEIAANLPEPLQAGGSDAALRSLELVKSSLSVDGRMPPGGPEAVRDYLKLVVDPSLNVDLAKTYTNEFLETQP